MTTTNPKKTAGTGRDVTSEIAFLTRTLKAPSLREAASPLAERARAVEWSHEEYLAACLQREVAARDAHGAEGRIRAARFADLAIRKRWGLSGWPGSRPQGVPHAGKRSCRTSAGRSPLSRQL